MRKVEVNPKLLHWALERSRIAPPALFKKFPKLPAWLAGDDQPTLRQLEGFAQRTHAPLGYLFLSEPPNEDLPIPDYRTLEENVVSHPSPELLDTVQLMMRRQVWLRDYLVEEGVEPLPFVGRSTPTTSKAEDVAADIRHTLALEPTWAQAERTWTDALATLRAAIEIARIIVVVNGIVANNTHRKLSVSEFRGFVLSDPYAPLIFVNGADAKAAQMFTLAHELAHIWIGETGVFDLPKLEPKHIAIEEFCNAVAAEFLVPAVIFKSLWNEASREDEPFQWLARQFKVSPLVVARRALDLKLIHRAAFFDFYDRYMDRERQVSESKTAEGGDFYATQDVRVGRVFGEAVYRAAKEGRLLYRDAYALTGLYGDTFDRYTKRFGVTP